MYGWDSIVITTGWFIPWEKKTDGMAIFTSNGEESIADKFIWYSRRN